jgi:hypothetical protein
VPVVLVLLLAAPPKIAAPGLTGVDIADDELRTYSGLLADKLAGRGAVILEPEDIAQLLGPSKPACAPEAPDCMGRLGHALAADGVVSGTVRRNGDELTFDLQLLYKKAGLTPWSGHAASPAQAQDAIAAAATVFGDTIGLPHLRPKRSPLWWVPAAVGAGFLAIGGLLAIPDANAAASLRNDPLTLDQANVVYTRGKTFETAWIACFAAAGIALIVSTVWLLVTKP